MDNINKKESKFKKIFSKRNIFYFLDTILILSFAVLYNLVGYKLQNKYDIARTNLFNYKGDLTSEVYLNLKKVYYEMEIYTKYYKFINYCVFFIGLLSSVQLFKYIGFKLEIKKTTKEEFNYKFIGSLIANLITLLIIILILLLFNKKQIASFQYFGWNVILLLYMTLSTISDSIVKKKLKKLKKAKIKLELGYLYEKD